MPVAGRRSRARRAWRQAERAAARVEHDEVVAEPCILRKPAMQRIWRRRGSGGRGEADEAIRCTVTPASVRSQATLTANLAPISSSDRSEERWHHFGRTFGQANSGSTPPAACVSRPSVFSRPFWRTRAMTNVCRYIGRCRHDYQAVRRCAVEPPRSVRRLCRHPRVVRETHLFVGATVVEQMLASATNAAVSVPTSFTVTASTASGRSVVSRVTSTGFPSDGVSS